MPGIDELVTALLGKLTSEDSKELLAKLEALSRIKTQEEYDEGARLHAEKNAPWVNGPYTHLGPAVLNPPYVYKAYPKMLYHPDYVDARKAVEDAHALPAHGTDDAERKKAVYLAERWLMNTMKIVGDAEEHGRYRGTWCDTPVEAYAAKVAVQRETAVQAAHLAYEDRHLGDVARREREEADDVAEDHLTDVQAVLAEKKRKPRAVGV